jgi:drug/metabolite transporter (DMT)-like permease
MLLTLVAMWGSSFMLVEVAIRTVPAATLVAARLAIGAGLLLVAMKLLRLETPRDRRTWLYFVALALLGNCIPFYLITWGQQAIDSGLAGILVGFMPLATLLLAHCFIDGERITRAKATGFVLGLAGLGLLLGPQAVATWRGAGTELLGQLACLGGAVCYAANSVLVKRMPPTHALVAAAWTTTLASGLMLPFAWFVDQPLGLAPDAAALVICAWLGLGPTAIATLVYFRLIARAGPTFMSLVNYMSPVVAVTAGMVLLDEPIRPAALGALALILGGIALATRRRSG